MEETKKFTTEDLGNGFQHEQPRGGFSENLRAVLASRKMRPVDLAVALHIAPTTVYAWTQGRAVPRFDKLDAICRFFHIYPEDLLRTQIPAPAVYADKMRYSTFTIHDDTMSPRLLTGDIVIADKQKDLEDGKPALVRIGGEMCCRIVSLIRGGVIVSCLSASIPPAFFPAGDPELVVIGPVIEARCKF